MGEKVNQSSKMATARKTLQVNSPQHAYPDKSIQILTYQYLESKTVHPTEKTSD